MAYTVRCVDASQVDDGHLAVWERNLTLPVQARRRFDWLYRDNPAGPGRMALLDSGPPGEAHTVGTAGYGTRAVRVGGRVLAAGVLADLAVDRAHRTALPAIMLARELRKQVLGAHELVYAFPNEHAGPVLLRLGYRKLAETTRYALALRHGRHVRARMGDRVAARMASVGLDAARGALVYTRAAGVLRDYRIDWLTDADQRFDRLWEEAGPDYPLMGVRDAAFVRWRFLSRPEGRLRLAALVARRTGTLDGYAVVERDGETAYVRDVFARRATLEPLLRLLCAALAWQGAESISLRVCGAGLVVACLQELGFRERPERRTIIVDASAALASTVDGIFSSATWYLTDADEDAG